ncbi:MAG: GNAT family N-acetyltransferase [Candidatus Odinarchaeia archaeon]
MRLYPTMFIIAEKNSESAIGGDEYLLSVIKYLRHKYDKTITIEEYMKIFNQPYERAKNNLEKILKISDSLKPPFRFFKKYYRDGISVYSLKEDPVIIGYIMCRLEKGISNFGFKWVKKGHIVSLAVDEDYRNQGVGKALLEKAIIEMEKQQAFEQVLEVRTTNYDAIHLYQNSGFHIIKTLKRYYHDGADAYLMARKS